MQNNLSEAEVKAQLDNQIKDGLRSLRKQCKQLSKNQLIDTLLQQLEAYSQLQAAAQQLLKENQTLKGNKDETNINPT